ncbi:T9SS type A sorting domain-containing protein [Spirosoma sp. 209]|uniref:Ig-like domain-containing protein n=1 Tax=Spirosoma sp. 209 TaxID=1955701 RepID=UPI00098D3243|nr:T9SS type A sorting domain-containing protein [Spirosoma sp. 209]
MQFVLKTLWATALLIVSSALVAKGQSLALYYGDPNGRPEDAFDGNVFRSGTEYGDASIYAVLSNGAQSFQIASPGENLTKTVTSTGYFTIRPTSSIVIDRTRILNFTGSVTGSVSINVKTLSISTISANVATEAVPGSTLTITYTTGAGTYPVGLAAGKFKAQLLDGNGVLYGDLSNSEDQYTDGEKFGSSRGGIRSIKATIPASVPPGTYRVRVVTQGLISNVLGTASGTFVIRTNTLGITAGTLASAPVCAGNTVSIPFTTTGSFPQGNQFRVRLLTLNGTPVQDFTETSATSPIRVTIPASLAGGAYQFLVFSTSTSTVSAPNLINIRARPTLMLSGGGSINAGARATVQLTFTGTPPWSVGFVDYSADLAPTYVRTLTFSSSNGTINPTLFSSSTIDRQFIKEFSDNGCGTSDAITGSAFVSVTPITVTTSSLSEAYCPGSDISVPFTVSSPLPADAVYRLQISDSNGNFQNAQFIGGVARTSPLSATIPQSLPAGTGYKLRVVLQEPTVPGAVDYTKAINPVPGSLIVSRPNAPGVTDVSFCQGASLSQLTATGTSLTWYSNGGTSRLAGAPIPPNDRSSQYQVSQTINGCESALATITVSIKALPPAPTVSSVAICQGGSGQFSTSIPGALWYTSGTGGTPAPQPPLLNSQNPGSQTVYVSQTINGCESPRTAVVAIVYPIPPAPAVQNPKEVCQYATASPLAATGQDLTWYDQSGKLAGVPVPETSTAGSKSYSVTQRINGCESPRSLVEQVVRAAPVNPVASSIRLCVGENPRSLTATGTAIRWYSNGTGGTGSPAPPGYFTDVANVFTFYVTQTDNNGCESQRQPVSVSVVAPPSAPTVTANQTVCQFARVNPLSAVPATDLVWQGPGIAGTTGVAPTPSTTEPATFTYSVAQRAGSCISAYTTILFTVRKTPEAPKVNSPAAFCIGQSSATLSATGEGQLRWYTNAGRIGPSLPQVLVNTQQASTTTYYVTQTDAFNCESPGSALTVRVSAKATALLTGDSVIYAGDSTAIRVRLTGDGPWSFTNWNSNAINSSDSIYVKWEKPMSTRTYTITNLTSACGRGDILNSYRLSVMTPLSNQASLEPLDVNAYPNPTTGSVTVSWSAAMKQEIRLQMINAQGQLIRQITRQATSVSQTEPFPLGSQPTGTYILRVITPKNGIVTRVIVKQ